MRESNPNSRLTIGGILNIRRTLVLAFGAGALTVSVGGFAQPTKTVKIGVAIEGSAAGTKIMVDAFRQGLRDYGYVEGRNALIVYGYTEGVPERGAQIAKQIIESNPDVIVVSSTGLAATFNDATSKIPIVVGAAGNLVRAGLVSSLARPGGNVTGSAGMAPDIAAKRLEMLKEIVPGLSRLGVVWHGSRGFSDEPEARELQAAAQKLGIAVQPAEVRDARDFRSPYASLVAQKADAIVIIQGISPTGTTRSFPNWPSKTGCLRFAKEVSGRRTVASSASDPTGRSACGAPQLMWTRFSTALSPAICRSNSRQSSNW